MGCVCCKECCQGGTYDVAGRRIRRQDGEEGEWRVRGQHVLRVFAQVLEMVSIIEQEEEKTKDNKEDDNEDDMSIEDEEPTPINNDDSTSEEESEASTESDDPFNWLWVPICDCPVHVNVACVKEGEVYEYTLYAEENEICPFTSSITIPGTDLKKTGTYFIQWKDVYTGRIYGLNFFTEAEALRFLSSCFPPNYTPDTSIRHTTTRPSYVTRSPPRPVTHLPFLEMTDNEESNLPETYNPHYGFDYRTSTPIPEPEFFKLPLDQIHPSHISYIQKPPISTKDGASSTSFNDDSLNISLSTLPRATSINSEASMDQNEAGPFPSPPSMYMVTDENSDEHFGDDQNEDMTGCDHELFQPTGPLEVNKILEDIPEEDELETNSRVSILTSVESSSNITMLNQTHSDNKPDVIEACLQNFDELLKDIRRSQLLEITESDKRNSHLSRQSSFGGGPPPLLPPTQPPGQTLSPHHNDIGLDDNNPFTSHKFLNALKRLSISSIDDLVPPSIPDTPAPGKLLSPCPSFMLKSQNQEENEINDKENIYNSNQLSNDSIQLPPPLGREDNDEYEFQRKPSFLHYPQPPDAFSSDSGLQLSSDAEPYPHMLTDQQGDIEGRRVKESQLLQAIRVPDVRKKTSSSSIVSETTESLEAFNYQGNSPVHEMKESTMEWSRNNSIKKTGWLEVKGMLVRKNRKVAMKSTRRWKRHWAILKGNQLYLHRWDHGPSSPINDTPVDTKIDISKSLAHPVHDHIKRDHIFCLSTYTGNTYYMQASNEAIVDDWIRAIHSAAALSVTGQTTKENALELLKTMISENELAIEKEKQMKNLADLQLTTATDSASKSSITKQVNIFIENIENYNMELYRNRCYVASLQHAELPNPQSLLASVSKNTKTTLTKVGKFTVASVHAIINVRSSSSAKLSDSNVPTSPISIQSNASSNTSKRKLFTLFQRNENKPTKTTRRRLFGTPAISKPLSPDGSIGPHLLTYRQLLEPNPLATGFGATLMINLPNRKICAVPFRLDLSVDDILLTCCKKFGLDPADHFLKLTNTTAGEEQECIIPLEDDLISNLTFTNLEISQKSVRTVQFTQHHNNTSDIGFKVQPDLRNLGSITHVIVESVVPGSQAYRNGIKEGDEIVLIDDTVVAHMSWSQVMEALNEPTFTITIRTRHYQAPMGVAERTTHLHLKDLVCPSPPVQGKKMSKKKLDDLIVPKPHTEEYMKADDTSESETSEDLVDDTSEDRVHQLIKGSLEVTGLVGRWKAYEEAAVEMTVIDDAVDTITLSPQKQLMKCVTEIIESEKQHVKMLQLLVDRYLEPLKLELFLPRDKIATISNNIINLVIQQKQFLGRIEELPDVYSSDNPDNIKALVQELAEAFIIHLDTFKQYSHFCATQHELKEIFINVENKRKLDEFLEARNPKQDPGLTLQSLLTKPVLRLLRYPLFLQSIKDLTDKNSEENQKISETIIEVAMVTEYINEVKRVTEAYANVFDILIKESGLLEFGISVRVSELLCHMTVMWLNSSGSGITIRGWRKGQGPEMECFVFNNNFTILCIERVVKRRPSKASLTQEAVILDDITHSALLPLAQCKVNDLPDSDGVSSMWQIVHKGRDINSQATTYILRSKSPKEKQIIVETLQQSIQEQLVLYGNISGSLSPTRTFSTTSENPSSPSHDNHMMRMLSSFQYHDSIDSEYELTLL